jgi:hypothetical protein
VLVAEELGGDFCSSSDRSSYLIKLRGTDSSPFPLYIEHRIAGGRGRSLVVTRIHSQWSDSHCELSSGEIDDRHT